MVAGPRPDDWLCRPLGRVTDIVHAAPGEVRATRLAYAPAFTGDDNETMVTPFETAGGGVGLASPVGVGETAVGAGAVARPGEAEMAHTGWISFQWWSWS